MNLPRLKLRARIYSGFGVLVAIAVALVGYGVWELSSIAIKVARMSTLSDNNTRALEIAFELEVVRRANQHYWFDGDEKALAEASEADLKAKGLIDTALRAVISQERRQRYLDVEANFEAFRAKRAELMRRGREIATEKATLVGGGEELTSSSAKLLDAARTSADRSIAVAAVRVETGILVVRTTSWHFLATRDPKGPAAVGASLMKTREAVATLEAMELPASARSLVPSVKAALERYATSFEALSTAILKQDDLWDRDMWPLVTKVIDGIKTTQGTLRRDFGAKRQETDTTIAAAITQQEGIGLAALLLGALIAFFVSRGIIGPIAGMTGAMERLAAGDSETDIPSRDNADEIGSMARAVEVFKQDAVERLRLEAEQKETETRVATARKADMQQLAQSFETAIGRVVEAVSSASTQLEAAANTLTHTADTTQQLAGVVTGASEEASANVQSVASAAEQLSSSVNEIARHVAESSHIASQAVTQAGATDARIGELSQAASRIGDVVKLITAIAEQTNLLALNATIEAARAGEAGRGFAVVAQEVKALAAQTAKATGEIGAQIAGMQTATQDSVTAIKEIGTTIGRISEIAVIIAAAVEEQGATTKEIARNVNGAAQSAAQVAVNIGDVNRSANATGSASAQVLASAQSLSGEGNRLKLEVEKFLTTVRAA